MLQEINNLFINIVVLLGIVIFVWWAVLKYNRDKLLAEKKKRKKLIAKNFEKYLEEQG